MRQFIVLCFALCCSTTLWADGPSQALLHKLSTKLASYKSYQVDFTASMVDEFDNVKGAIVVSGAKYYVSANGFEIFCDGKMLSTYNESQDEVTLERNDAQSLEPLSNPARFFRLSETDFASRLISQSGGKTVIELTPRAKNSSFTSIRLTLSSTTGLPSTIIYRAEGAKPVAIVVRKLTPNVAVAPATFTFDRKKYPGVEVIDFR